MDDIRKIELDEYTFCGKWDIDSRKFLNHQGFSSEANTVKEMPGLLWYISYQYKPATESYDVIFNVETDLNVKYEISVKHTPRRFTSKFNKGVVVHNPEFVEIDAITAEEYNNNPTITLTIHGSFLYTTAEYPKIKDCTEWGNRLINTSVGKNFNIVVDKQIIKVHKCLLAAESTYFNRMFENEKWKETEKNQISIDNFRHDTVKAAVEYCYGQSITSCFFDANSVAELYKFAELHDFNNLKLQLEDYIAKSITKENIEVFSGVASKLYSNKIKTACLQLIHELEETEDAFTAEELQLFIEKLLTDVLWINHF